MDKTGMGDAGMNGKIKPTYADLPQMPAEKMTKIYPQNTICQILRTLYMKTEDEEIKVLCRIATLMAKKMEGKLRMYNKTWDKGWWK